MARNFCLTDDRLHAQRITPRLRQTTKRSAVKRAPSRTATLEVSTLSGTFAANALRAVTLPDITFPSFAPLQRAAESVAGTKSEIRRRGGMIPAWVFFGMVALALFGVCVNANLNAYAEHSAARGALAQEQTALEAVGNARALLADEVRRLKDDPQTIENEARANLRMVRSNEIVVSTQIQTGN